MTKKLKVANEKGFTLIEILIVIIIIATLAAIVTINITNTNKTSQLKACKLDYQSISSANSSYFNDANIDAANLSTLVEAGYLSKWDGYGANPNVLTRNSSPFQITLTNGTITVTGGDGCVPAN